MSNQEINMEALEFLTEGSVWQSPNGNSYVIGVTNVMLPEKAQRKMPPQVVYYNDDGFLISCDLPTFLKSRTFYNVDPQLEHRAKNLIQVTGADEPAMNLDEIVDAAVQVPDAVTAGSNGAGDVLLTNEDVALSLDHEILAGAEPEVDQSPLSEILDNASESTEPVVLAEVLEKHDLAHGFGIIAESDFAIGFWPSDEEGTEPPVIDADTLLRRVVSYSAEPRIDLVMDEETGQFTAIRQKLHKITFALAPTKGITAEAISRCFNPSVLEQEKRAFFAQVAVTTGGVETVIDWDLFVGVYPMATLNGSFAVLNLVTEPRDDQDEDDGDDVEIEHSDVQVLEPEAVVEALTEPTGEAIAIEPEAEPAAEVVTAAEVIEAAEAAEQIEAAEAEATPAAETVSVTEIQVTAEAAPEVPPAPAQ